MSDCAGRAARGAIVSRIVSTAAGGGAAVICAAAAVVFGAPASGGFGIQCSASAEVRRGAESSSARAQLQRADLATRELADAMHQTAAQCDADTDEFKLAGLTPVAGRIVAAPLVAESPVAFECQCSQIIQLRSAAGDPIDAWLVLGEVQGIHIDKTLLEDGIYNTAKARPVLRGGPPAEYFEVTAESLFRLSLRNGTVT